MDDLVVREGLWYEKFTDVPFTGEINEGLEKGLFEKGKRSGEWIVFFENGQLKEKGHYDWGIKQGYWVSYSKVGYLESRGIFNNGIKDGSWTIRESWRGYGVGTFVNGKKDGVWEHYWDSTLSGLMLREHFVKGIRHGPFQNYWEDGQQKAIGQFKNGEKSGYWIFHDSDGSVYQPWTGTFVNGVKVSD